MNENPKVSVIIPVYNMSQWISKAIDTVEQQTLKEGLEVICVDDGSTDNTLFILEHYAQKYDNIIVIHQENKGSGPARNLGMEKARGEYIAFLDADDYYYSDDVLEYLYDKAKANHANVCRGSTCDDRDGILVYKGLRPERSFSEEGFISKEVFPGATFFSSGIYCREFLLGHSIHFPALLRGQDVVFTTEVIARAGKVYCLPKIVYVCRKDHKYVFFTEKKATDYLESIYQVLKIARENQMVSIFSCWKKELYGEPTAMLYKYAAAGNTKMLSLATKLNNLIGGGLLEGKEINEYVKKAEKEKDIFLKRYKDIEFVYIFGAGTIGRKVISFFKENNITPAAVIVSDPSQNPDSVDEIPVKSINAVETDCDYDVIIATFGFNHDSITSILRENGVNNVTPINLCVFYLWQDEIIH